MRLCVRVRFLCTCVYVCAHAFKCTRSCVCMCACASKKLDLIIGVCTPAGHELLPPVVLLLPSVSSSLTLHPCSPVVIVACNGTRAGKQQNIRRMQCISTNINMGFISTFKAPLNLETNGTNPLIARTKTKEDIIPGICDMITVLDTRAL